MPQHTPGEFQYFEEIQLTQADFTNGSDNTSSVSAGTRGEIGELEIGELEIGEDGEASGYDILTIGGRKQSTNDEGARLYVDLEDSSDTDIQDTAQFRFVGRDKNGNRVRPLTKWMSVRNADNSDPRQRPEVVYRGFQNHTWIPNGKLVVLEVKDESTTVQESLANSELEIPALAGSR